MTREDRTEGIRYVKDIKSYSRYSLISFTTVSNILDISLTVSNSL